MSRGHTSSSNITIASAQTKTMDTLQTIYDGFIDYEGQKLAEQLITVLLGFSGIVAWITGFVMQDLSYTLWVGLGGAALTALVVVPPWPFYNKNSVTWLPAGTEEVVDKKEQ